ncbi:SRPBCC family protein [Micromonospora coxensis]|uniref:Polyketide cyclase / dehydrase and lipid transport n=1 Tax=Micromonospora coxensis TaxID=356852 RepID=A0A1C5HTQ6_9ACTN|nr:hypothetical protein [Micromonospora coxensis]SCG49416.1 hypothetical protein GA0070614_1783 [Micromonospora coxensis]
MGRRALVALRARVVPRWRRRPGAVGADPRPGRWQVVTVDRPAAEVLPGGRWPEPLRPLDGAVELWLRPAPGGRGTELAARPLGGVATLPGMAAHLVGDDPGLFLRDTLRRVKQLVETGEVLRADASPMDRPAVPG